MPSIWDPIQIGAATSRNRLYLPAHTPTLAPEVYGQYIGERALGGVGLIVSTTLMTHPSAAGRASSPWSRDAIPRLELMVGPALSHGALVLMQIGHTGPSWPPSIEGMPDWSPTWAASAIQSPKHHQIPKAMEISDIEELIEGFCNVAANAQEAGATGVEIHAAHGYLLSGFISPYWNRRSDRYGGSTENRSRIVREIVTAVRKRVGSSFVVGLRMNVEEYLGDRGLQPAEAMTILSGVHALGQIDYFCVSHSDYHTNQYLLPPDSSGIVAPLAPIGKLAKTAVADEIPVLVHGSIRNLAKAQDIMDSGCADMVGLVRAQIADAHLVNKTRSGRVAEVQRCVGANQGCWRRIGRAIACTVNPVTGNEGRYGLGKILPAAEKHNILVIGGGPGGMKYASTAAERGHDVTLWERSDRLGGNVRHAALLPDYDMWNRLIEDLSAAMQRNGVKVERQREATEASVVAFGADLTVVATGATWDMRGFSTYRPEIDFIAGIDAAGDRVLDPVTALTHSERCGEHVVIIDDNGDYLPLGLARHLRALGKRVTVVTWDDGVGRKMHATNELPFMLPNVFGAGVRIVTGAYVDRINDTTVDLVGRWTGVSTSIKADTVVLSMLRAANETLYLDLKAAGLNLARVGDCVAPREVDDAIVEAFRLGAS